MYKQFLLYLDKYTHCCSQDLVKIGKRKKSLGILTYFAWIASVTVVNK